MKQFGPALTEELTNLSDLTKSERIILKCIAEGNSSADIAEKLNISKRTVQNHRSNIILKLKSELLEEELSQWASKNKELISRL